MRPQHPKARDLRREELELLPEHREERARAPVAREERRCVLTPHRIRRVVHERRREEARRHDPLVRPGRRIVYASVGAAREEERDACAAAG